LSAQEKIPGILEDQLRKIYGVKMQKLEVVNTMPYPMKDHLFVVRYNIDLENEVPIRRAQIALMSTAEN
jgi:hypothetical protein